MIRRQADVLLDSAEILDTETYCNCTYMKTQARGVDSLSARLFFFGIAEQDNHVQIYLYVFVS